MSDDRTMRPQAGISTPPLGGAPGPAAAVGDITLEASEYTVAIRNAEKKANNDPESAQAWALIALARATHMQGRGK